MRLATCALAFAALAPPSPGQCPTWSSLPNAGVGPEATSAVFDAATHDDGSGEALYLAGDFYRVAGAPLAGVARWDGVGFQAIGTIHDVRVLFEHDFGSGVQLVAGGDFGLPAGNRLSRWDGNAWSELAPGVGSATRVKDLASFDEGAGAVLFVGAAGKLKAGVQGVGRFDGTKLTKLGTGLEAGALAVNALLEHDDGSGSALYVGGNFTQAGGQATMHIGRWDGSAWSVVGAGFNGEVRGLAEFRGELYAGGDFTASGAVPLAGIARWDGAQWLDVGSGLSGLAGTDPAARSFAIFDDGDGPALFVGGNFTGVAGGALAASGLARWDGASWTAVDGGVQVDATFNGVHALAAFIEPGGEALFVGGKFSHVGDLAGGTSLGTIGLARWDQGWTAVGPTGSALDGEVRALLDADDGAGRALFAGGGFLHAGSRPAARVARFDGLDWTALGAGLNGTVYALCMYDAGSGPELYAGGDFTPGHIARFDGSSWVPVGAGTSDTVRALAVYDDGFAPQLVAGGDFNKAGGMPANHIASWNGSAWSLLKSGTSDRVRALEVFDDGAGERLFVGGGFGFAGSMASRFLAAWDGTDWHDLGGNLDGEVYDLTVWDDGGGVALYFAGGFNTVAGTGMPSIARWDGVAFSPLGQGLSQSQRAVAGWHAGSGGDPLIVGSNAWLGGQWLGPQWASAGSGVFGTIRTLASFAPQGAAASWPALYAGSTPYSTQLAASYIGHWEDPCACQGVSYCTAGTSASGCTASMSSTGSASRSSPSGFVLDVASVEGGKDGLIFFGTAGAQANPWGNGSSFQCVVPPVRRTGVLQGSGAVGSCGGSFQLDFNAWMQSHALAAPAAGQTVWAQAWFRDPNNGSNQSTSLSDGLRFGVCP